MSRAKRILFIMDTKDYSDRFLKCGSKQTKGFIKLGHDARIFNYKGAFHQAGFLMSRKFARRLCKSHIVDKLLIEQIKNYQPDIIYIHFVNYLDAITIARMREVASDACFIGWDGDMWPEYHKGRITTAGELDILMTSYDGKGIKAYSDAGLDCSFMPNLCDPDIEYRYNVSEKWKSDIIFTGQTREKHKYYPTEDTRIRLLSRLADKENCALYGCFGKPKIGGIQYLYAISGAKIGLSVNAVNDIPLAHSNRLTQYLSCGTFVLAKRVPDSDLLFKDGVHLRYFETPDEFFELVDWYLGHENERKRIADAGMQYVHAEFNSTKIAGYTLDLIDKGSYKAPWTD